MVVELPVPLTVDEITAEWLCEALSHDPNARCPQIVAMEKTVIGDEKGFLSQVVRAAVTYETATEGLPASFIVKIEPQKEAFREAAHNRNSFVREIRFYTELAPALSINVPDIFFAAIGPEASVLVMQDLGHLMAYDQVSGIEHDRVVATARSIAGVHAAYWNHDGLDRMDWVPDHEHFHSDGFEQHWPAFADAYRLRIGKEGMQLGQRVAENLSLISDMIAARPTTLIHGDLRSDNILFGERGSPGEVMIIDWQGANRSMAAIDVARLLGGSEPVAERRGRQMEVFEAWYRSLLDAGVINYDHDQALHDFRLGVLYCLFIPVKIFHLTGGEPSGRTARFLDTISERH